LRREDGSSGVLTTSNDRVVEYALTVENVGQRAWDVVIYDRIPVSEQEDLLIDWSARTRRMSRVVAGCLAGRSRWRAVRKNPSGFLTSCNGPTGTSCECGLKFSLNGGLVLRRVGQNQPDNRETPCQTI